MTSTNAANRDYAQPVYAALDSRPVHVEITNGFAGADSDGLVELDASHALTDVVPEREQRQRRADGANRRERTRALRFTARSASVRRSLARSAPPSRLARCALAVARRSLRARLAVVRRGSQAPAAKLPGISLSRCDTGRRVLPAPTCSRPPRTRRSPARLSPLASPWGQAVSAGDPQNTYFGSYREVFARDLYEIWTGLMADGDTATARDATLFLFLTASSSPTARCRGTASSTASPRPTPSTRSSTRRRTRC